MMRRVLCVLVASVCVWSVGCSVKEGRKPSDPPAEKQAKEDNAIAHPADTTASQQPARDTKPAAAPDDAEAWKALESAGATLKKGKDGQTDVSFRGTTVDESFLAALAKLPRLKTLVLSESGVTDENLKSIGSLQTLGDLDLRGCKISNAGIAALSGLTNLQALRLNGKNGATTVDDKGLASIAQLTNLKVLLLDQLWISDEGLKQLTGLTNLEELCLAQTMTTDAGMESIQTLTKLRKLRISATQITSQGLAGVAKLDSTPSTRSE